MQLSERMKLYEQVFDSSVVPNLPVLVRIDGKSFHSWTRQLQRPYDAKLFELFDQTTMFLMEESNAILGYTQSDEISILLYNNGDSESQIFFDGRINKLVSVLASMTTAFFNRLVPEALPNKKSHMAFFDARVFNLPDLNEAANYFLWRELDATRNSIQMAAQALYSHNQLYEKNNDQMQDMLFQKGINWNDYPARFKRGAFFKKVKTIRKFEPDELGILPEKHSARLNPDLAIERSEIKRMEIKPLMKLENRLEILFWKETLS